VVVAVCGGGGVVSPRGSMELKDDGVLLQLGLLSPDQLVRLWTAV